MLRRITVSATIALASLTLAYLSLACLSLACLLLASVPLAAGEVEPEVAPRPAQIEPMVAPVKRTAPQMPANTSKAVKTACISDAKRTAAGEACMQDSGTETPAKKTLKKASGKKVR